jgi:hypothetical protein
MHLLLAVCFRCFICLFGKKHLPHTNNFAMAHAQCLIRLERLSKTFWKNGEFGVSEVGTSITHIISPFSVACRMFRSITVPQRILATVHVIHCSSISDQTTQMREY